MQTQPLLSEEWVKVLAKGMITLPKKFRDALGIREGEVARIKQVGKRLVVEPRDVADYEVYSDKELAEMLEADTLPTKLAKKAGSFWRELP